MAELDRLRKDKKRAQAKGLKKEVANLSNVIGNALQEVGDYEAALEEHEEEAAITASLGDKIGSAVAYRRIGEVYCEMKKWKNALVYQKKHLKLSLEANDFIEIQRAYATIGRTYFQWAESPDMDDDPEILLKESEGAYLLSLKSFEKLDKILDVKELSEMRCRIYHNLGLVLDLRGKDIPKAIQLIKQSLELSNKHSFFADSFRSYAELARMHIKQEKFQFAHEESLNCLKMACKLNKAHQVEAHGIIAQVYLYTEDYTQALKHIGKAYRLKHPIEDAHQENGRVLKSVFKLFEAANSLNCDSSTLEDRLKLYEKLADECINLALYSKAIKFYKKAIETANELGKDSEFFGPLYVSLAQTYRDMKDPKTALKFFQKELDIFKVGDPKDSILTLIEMDKTFDMDSIAYDERYFNEALDIAKAANQGNLMVYSIKSHLDLKNLSNARREELKQTLDDVCSSYSIDENYELSSNENSESEEEIDIENLVFSDSDEEDCPLEHSHRKAKKPQKYKLTEKGESPLHLAAIKGDLKKVQILLNQNHPVNVRDYCGWIPLHEACNFGFCDVAEALLDAGASVNDRGGANCQGITPLHDAASNGHVDVIRLLLKRGASPILRSDSGETPLDFLIKYLDSDDLTFENRQECESAQEMLLDAMKRAGYEHSEIKKIKESISHKSSLKDFQLDEESMNTSADESCLSNQDDDFSFEIPIDTNESATNLYKKAMNNLRSFNKQIECKQRSISPKKTIAPLLPEHDYITDDWLSDDLGESSKKRKREASHYYEPQLRNSPVCKLSRKKQAKFKDGIRTPGSSSENQKGCRIISPSRDLEGIEEDYRMISPSRDLQEMEEGHRIISPTRDLQEMEEGHRIISPSRDLQEMEERRRIISTPQDIQRMDSSCAVTRPVEVPRTSLLQHSPLRLNVLVKCEKLSINESLLVPVAPAAQYNSIQWLENEVSRRFFHCSRIKTNVSLTVKEDEILNRNDAINMIFSNENNKLIASFTDYVIPSMSDQYDFSCRDMKVDYHLNIKTILHEGQYTGILDFSKSKLKEKREWHSVFHSFKYQKVNTLNFAECQLRNQTIPLLIKILPSLYALAKLDLQASGLTSDTFDEFSKFCTNNTTGLKNLSYLDLSYNNFSRTKIAAVKTVISLPSLITLKLNSCYMTLASDNNVKQVASNVQVFELNDNNILLSSLEELIVSLPLLQNLSLSNAVSVSSMENDLSFAISSLFGGGNECLLKSLNLQGCKILDDHLGLIIDYLYRCSALESLNLSHNDLSLNVVDSLLRQISLSSLLPLRELSLFGIKSLCDKKFINSFSQCIRSKFASYPFTRLSLPYFEGLDCTFSIWREFYKDRASVIKCGTEVCFSVKKMP